MTKITYGLADTEFGQIVLGKTDKGLCWLGFMVEGYKGNGLDRMRAHFTDADFTRDDSALTPLADKVVQAWKEGTESEMALDLQGTAFQQSVWHALLKIKKGQVKTYGDVANDIGKPKASRAVGTAIGSNPVSLIVPCHRVVPGSGGVGNYGWGTALKEKLLAAESQT